jgi:hypothetical protein
VNWDVVIGGFTIANVALDCLIVWFITREPRGYYEENPDAFWAVVAKDRAATVEDTGTLITLPDDPQGLV